jgi:hypothetical protein
MARMHVTRAVDKRMNECFFGLQDLEKAYREGDAARRNLRDVKEAQVQALRAQSAAFEQTLEDAKTVAAQVLPASPAQLPLLSCLAILPDPCLSINFPLRRIPVLPSVLTLAQACPCCTFGPCPHFDSL